jgi:tetratricopeptide (TPR) repeat protein
VQVDALKAEILSAVGFDKQQKKPLVGIVRDLKSEGKFKEAHKVIDDFTQTNEIAELFKEKGDIYLDEGNYDKAIMSYDKAIDLNPYNVGAFNNKGVAYLKLDQLRKAVVSFTEAVRIKPSNSNLRKTRNDVINRLRIENYGASSFDSFKNRPEKLNRDIITAITLSQSGQIKGALDLIDRILTENKDLTDVLSIKAQLLATLGQYEEAIRIFNQILEQKPKELVLLMDIISNKGVALKKLERFEEALQCYDEVIKLDPEVALTYTNKGNVLMELNRIEESIKIHKKAINLDPVDEKNWNNLGVAQLKMNDFDNALKSFNEALRLNNKFHPSFLGKGIVLKKIGKFEESAEIFDNALKIEEALPSQALDMDPSYAKGKHEKMKLVLSHFKDKKEISFIDRMPLMQIRAMKLHKKGDFLRDHQRFEDAINCYDLAIDSSMHSAHSWSAKAYCLSMLERYDEALEAYDVAIKKDTDIISFFSIIGKANLLMKMQNYREAIKMFDKVLESGENAMALNGKANALLHLNEFEEAEKMASRAIKENQNLAEAWYHRGVALLKMGDNDEGMKALAKAANLDPKYADAVKNFE